MEINAKLPLLRDSDNTYAGVMRISRNDDRIIFELDGRREVEVSYDHFRRISELFAQE